MKATTVREDYVLYAECKRLYLLDAHTDPNAAERYLAAIEDIDSALLYIDAHAPNAFATTPDGSAEMAEIMEVLDRLTQEELEFNRSQKERDAKQ
jgi:hypothetical protein